MISGGCNVGQGSSGLGFKFLLVVEWRFSLVNFNMHTGQVGHAVL